MMLEPGVYQEWFGDRCNFDIVIIVGPFTGVNDYSLKGCAWRNPDIGWSSGEGAFCPKDLRPHPDPDVAWAEYCAWVLTQ